MTATLRHRDPVAAAIEAYDRTAVAYAQRWDDYRNPVLEAFADRVAGPVLDAGCGTGRDLAAFARAGADVVGVALSEQMTAVARRAGVPVSVADLWNLPHHTGTFAGIWASASLVHLPAPDAVVALAELRRVAVTDAVAHVTVKAHDTDQPATGVEGSGDTARWFQYWTPCSFSVAAATAGWAVEALTVDADSQRPEIRWVTAHLHAD